MIYKVVLPLDVFVDYGYLGSQTVFRVYVFYDGFSSSIKLFTFEMNVGWNGLVNLY